MKKKIIYNIKYEKQFSKAKKTSEIFKETNKKKVKI